MAHDRLRRFARTTAGLAALGLAACSTSQPSFPTPEFAVLQLVGAMRAGDVARTEAVLGPDSGDIVRSGDAVADQQARRWFVAAFDEKHRFEPGAGGAVILSVGNEDWPMPIPLVKAGSEWRFDAAAGRDELLTRRIGRNELGTIEVCLAYLDAQLEYAEQDRDGDGILEYAQRIRSTPGQRDGLFWPQAAGELPSPLGEFAANAVREGYRGGEGPRPYHGYYYRILAAQGEHATGGAFDYVAHGSMIGGHALVAYPAEYGASGVMTFLVNHDGVVFQKDLGEETTKLAEAMTTFDPDPSWKRARS
jgi:hypothetical protein